MVRELQKRCDISRPLYGERALEASSSSCSYTTGTGGRTRKPVGIVLRQAMARGAQHLDASEATNRCRSPYVESIRCIPHFLIQPPSLNVSTTRPKRRGPASALKSRARHAESTEHSQPTLVNSRSNRYVQSLRARTALAACRSERSSTHGNTHTGAKRHGTSAGCPVGENRSFLRPPAIACTHSLSERRLWRFERFLLGRDQWDRDATASASFSFSPGLFLSSPQSFPSSRNPSAFANGITFGPRVAQRVEESADLWPVTKREGS